MSAAPSLADRFDGWLLDLDGVVYVGDRALPGAPETIIELRRRDHRVVFVTNDPRSSRAEYAAKLRGLGVPVLRRRAQAQRGDPAPLPVVGSWPGKDFTTKAAAILETELTAAGIPHDLKVYPGAKHSFFNDRLRNYHAAAAADSWQRALTFFAEHVGRRPAGPRADEFPPEPRSNP